MMFKIPFISWHSKLPSVSTQISEDRHPPKFTLNSIIINKKVKTVVSLALIDVEALGLGGAPAVRRAGGFRCARQSEARITVVFNAPVATEHKT